MHIGPGPDRGRSRLARTIKIHNPPLPLVYFCQVLFYVFLIRIEYGGLK